MKVLMINGSPHKKGCTFTALSEIADTLTKEGIENLQQDVELEEEVPLTIPNELMIDAEIPLDADLDVI
ncbi:NAD(P)H-dependent oxidoreductase, partial [Emergencia timonensis]|uniref:NAD(P)H-dependent oxidoreductase n=1 Tax=Emergencia timonensis TaxID=1776384 RepID=UPI002ED3D12D